MIQPHISSLLNSIKYPFLVSRRQREPRGRQMLGLAAQHSQELSRINVSNFHGKCRLFLPSLSISIGIMAATCCPCRRGGVPDEAEKIEIWHKSRPHWAINRGMGTLRTYSDETSICFKDYKYFTISLKKFFQLFSVTEEIDACPEKSTLNELSANSFAFIFRNSASILDNSESFLLLCVTQFLNRRIENQ